MSNDNTHMMTTRSKKESQEKDMILECSEEYEDMDDEGNLTDLVVKDTPEKKHKSPNTRSKKKPEKPLGTPKPNRAINDMLMSYLIMKATDKANEELQKRRKSKRHKKHKKPLRKAPKKKATSKPKKSSSSSSKQEITIELRGELAMDHMDQVEKIDDAISDISLSDSDDSFKSTTDISEHSSMSVASKATSATSSTSYK